MKKLLFILLVLLFIPLTSCKKKDLDKTVLCSTYPVYDLTKRIVGDKYNVSCFVPNGIEPHEFEPTPSKLTELTDCILYVENGLGLEKYTLDSSIKSKTLTITDGIELLYSMKNDKIVDPHVWLSIRNAIKMMENVKNKLVLLDSDNKDYYEDNFNKNKVLFEALDLKYSFELSNLKSNYLATTHEAFGYLCKDYGLTQISIMGISTEDKPTAKQLAAIEETIKDKNITTIFSEEMQSASFAASISKTLNIKCDTLNTIEISSDDIDDYLTMMSSNLIKIKEALV